MIIHSLPSVFCLVVFETILGSLDALEYPFELSDLLQLVLQQFLMFYLSNPSLFKHALIFLHPSLQLCVLLL